ncbi:hypothetical protein ACFC80_14325 [Enterococcus casseliflavus]|uniref:hypothetical protein n=1 Tax=Enterococcus casseliflavus TaxID=37734 RepID=UPI0039A5BC13|nr:hypothetical protein [Enterococcus faecium]
MSNFDFSNLSSNSNNNNDDKDFIAKVKVIVTIIVDSIVKYSKIAFNTASPFIKEKSGELAKGTKNMSNKALNKYEQKQKEKKVYLKYKTINKIYDDFEDSILTLENEVKEANKKDKKEKEQTNDKSSIALILLIAVIALVIIFKFILSNFFAIILILIAFAPLLSVFANRLIIKNNKDKLDKVAIFRPDLKKIFEKMALYINDDDLYDFIKYYQSELINLETFLNIKLDANRIELLEDKEDEELLLALGNVKLNQNSKVIAETLNDVDMNKFNIVTQANYLVKDNNILILFDNCITDYLKVGKAIDIADRIEELGYSSFFETGEEAEEVDLSRFSRKGKQIISKLRQDVVKEKLGMYPHDAFSEGITENKYFIKIRMVLQNTNKAKAKSLLNEIGLITGITPSLIDGENDKTIYLKFKYKVDVKSRGFRFKDILEQAKDGVINIGATDGGDYVVKYPRQDDPFFALIGGLSRSGKSTLASRMIATALYLSDGDGYFDYQDVFIASVKAKDDYFPLKWEEKGMFITDSPVETYKMLLKINDIAQKRAEIFRKNGCVNIKQYNKKFKSNNKMGKILLVMDEYRNTLDSAERMGKVEIDGNEIKNLSLEIEKIYTSINTLHGSRGVNTICITQKFAKSKGGLGMVADSLDSRFLGYAEADVWNTQDKSETISKYLKTKSEQRKGLFLINATAFQQSNAEFEVDKIGGFVETRTHYIDTQEIADNFDRYFDTDEKYGELIRETAFDEHVDSIITNTNESEEVLEDKEKEEKTEESKTIEDFDFDDFNL